MLLIILAAYLALVFYLASRKTRVDKLDEFLISRGTLSPYVLGVSFGASYASVSLFMGVSGWAYQWGESVLFYQGSVTLCTLLGLCVFALGFRRLAETMKPLSLADWIGKRYNSRFLRAGVSVLTLWNVFYIAGQYIAVALILDAFFGLPYLVSVLLAGVVSVLFVVFGGMGVNVRSDFLQGTLMLLVAGVVLWRGAAEFGFSPARLHESLAAVGPEFVSLLNPNSPVLNTPWALISIVWLLFIFPANPHLMSIVLALREPAEFTKFLLSAGACLLVFSLAPLTGLYARGMGLELEKADAAFPQFLLHVFPETVAFLLILAVLSAGLTTVSSLLVSLSGAFAHDLRTLVMGSRDAGISENRRLRLGRVGILLVAIVACAIALTRPPSLTILVWVGINGILSGVTGPLLGGIFLREPSRRAAVTSFLTGIATYLVCYPWLIKNVLAAGALAGVVGLVVMLLTHSLAPRAHAAP